MTDEVKTGRGGARPGAGRKKSEYDYEAVNDVIVINSKNCKVDFTANGSNLLKSLLLN